MSADLRRLLESLTEGCKPGPWRVVESGDKDAYGWWLENPSGDSSFPDPDDVALMLNALPGQLAVVDAAQALVDAIDAQRGKSSAYAAGDKRRLEDALRAALTPKETTP